MTEKYQPIPHRLKNMAVGGHVAGAVDIFDDNLNRDQQEINENTYRKDETYNREQIEYMAATHDENFVNLEAESGDTLEDIFDGVTGAAKTLYRVGNWNGTQYNTAKYSQYTFDGTNFVLLQVVNAGIDEEPVENSSNLIESGGVYNDTLALRKNLSAEILNYKSVNYSILANGNFGEAKAYNHAVIPVEEGERYLLTPSADNVRYAFATSDECTPGEDIPLVTDTEVYAVANGKDELITIPNGCHFLLFNDYGQVFRKYVENAYDHVASDAIDVTNNTGKGNVIRGNISAGAVNIIPDKYKNSLVSADKMYFQYVYRDGYLVPDSSVGTHAYVYNVSAGDILTFIGKSSTEIVTHMAWFLDSYDLSTELTDSALVFKKVTDGNINKYAFEFVAPSDGVVVVYVPTNISYRALKKVNNEGLKNKRHVAISGLVTTVGKCINADVDSPEYGEVCDLNTTSRGVSDFVDVSDYTHLLIRIPYITAQYPAAPVFGGVFYDEEKEPLSNAYISERPTWEVMYGSEMTYIAVPTGAKYIRVTDLCVTGDDNTNEVIRDPFYGVTDEDAVINDEGGISEKYFKDAVVYNMAKKMALSTKEVTLIPRPENCSNLYWRTYQEKNFMYGSAGIYRLSWFPKVFVKGGSNLVINYTGSLEIAIIELGYVPLDSNFYRVIDTATGKINITNLPKIGDEDYTGTYTLSLNKNTTRVVVEIGISNNTTVELAPKDITDYVSSMTVICPKWNNMRLEEEGAAGSYDDLFDQAGFVGDEVSIKPFRVYQYTDIHHDKAAAANVENFVGTYRSRMDAILFTGDLVKSTSSESGAKWWREETELPTFSLFTLGNHDGATTDATEYDQKETGVAWDGRGKDWDFEQYFADYIESVGYVMPEGYDDEESDYYHACFWHKDFADQKVRLIGLDCMHRFDGIVDPVTGEITSPGLKHLTNEQEVWFIEKLNETLDSENDAYGYSVVVACHYTLDDFSGDNEEWNDSTHKFVYNHKSTGGRTMSYKTGAPVNFHLEDVTSFNASAIYNMRNRVDNGYSQGQPYPNFTKGTTNNMGEILKYWMEERGGKFVAWISGHVHRDYMYYSTKYPDILIIACDCAGSLTANHHTKKLQASDLNGISNYYSIDTQNGLIKFVRIGHTLNMYFNSHSYLCYDYINKKVLNEG